MTDEQAAAMDAAADAAEVTAELIRFAREGEFLTGFPFDNDAPVHAAAALQTVLEIELPRMSEDAQQGATWTRERETAEQLLTAIAKFREVWG